jgi:hypothetical protein
MNENWWNGRIGERIGIFPTTYTWQLDSNLLKVSQAILELQTYGLNFVIHWVHTNTSSCLGFLVCERLIQGVHSVTNGKGNGRVLRRPAPVQH